MAVKPIYSRPQSLCDKATHYCPGCGHGVAHRLVAEALDHFRLQDKAVGVASAGCSVMMYDYFDVDTVEAAHGRALAVATGMKRANPNLVVFTYQGDGDLASIGMCETIHTANRGEKITVIFINNAVYGMTGGQMAPTTLPGQKTTTTPFGRSPERDGNPIKMAELLAGFDGVAYSERVAVFNAKQVIRARKAVFRAFEAQLLGSGLGFVEILSPCVTNLKLSPADAQAWVAQEMCAVFPLGLFKSSDGRKSPSFSEALILEGSCPHES
ncbi:MAG: thiamine pyrophosphate-dependent enzyme [Candidatus Hydrogenedentales bacterium]|jgi:2-oxoglutarate ferredoxin oxidoreductase subunit beta